jgi:Phytanoyl-CoA dioxygenase (PhyH)
VRLSGDGRAGRGCGSVGGVTSNPHLSAATAAGATDHVDVAWDRGNDQWWDWYMSLADNPAEAGPMVEGPAPWTGPLPSDEELTAELAAPYPLPAGAVEFFAAESYVKLPGVLSPGAVERLRVRLRELLDAVVDPAVGFQSLELMWLTDPLVRAAVLSPRIGGICAALLRADRVRLYHDNALSKESGAGRTPWHYDAHHFPLDTHDVVTAWAPLQPTPREMGPLAFAAGAESWRLAAEIPFDKHGTSYDRQVSQALRDAGVRVEDGPFATGEVSFHSSTCLHTAAGNRTTVPRMVLATTYFADGARVVRAPTMVSGDWQKFVPGTGPGQVVASERNPVVA